MALGSLDVDAAWLRVPVDRAHPDVGPSAAGAALVDLSEADGLVALEAPCFRLAATATAGFMARGGLDAATVPDRFGRLLIEQGRDDGTVGPRKGVPPGLLAWWLRHQGILSMNGAGTLVIDLAASGDNDALCTSRGGAPSEIVQCATGTGTATAPEARLWDALADVQQRAFGRVEVVAPVDVDAAQLEGIRHDGASSVTWVGHPADTPTDGEPDGAQDDLYNDLWIAFAQDLMP